MGLALVEILRMISWTIFFGKKVTVEFAGISRIGKHFFDVLSDVPAIRGAIGKISGIVDQIRFRHHQI